MVFPAGLSGSLNLKKMWRRWFDAFCRDLFVAPVLKLADGRQ